MEVCINSSEKSDIFHYQGQGQGHRATLKFSQFTMKQIIKSYISALALDWKL